MKNSARCLKNFVNNEKITVAVTVTTTTFHVMDPETPFLMCLEDIDRLYVYQRADSKNKGAPENQKSWKG